MDKHEKAIRVAKFGKLDEPFRNIRVVLDGTSAVMDLIPRKILERVNQEELKDWPREVQKALKGTKPIVEADSFLQVEFENVQGLIVQEEFIDKINLVGDRDELRDGTFATIVNSSWRARLEDFEMGNNPHLKHYRAWSDETRIDVLGVLIEGKWMQNNTD
ncbi:MAG: hypothetical protein AAFO74_06045 [Pseudomonadota bacterium]